MREREHAPRLGVAVLADDARLLRGAHVAADRHLQRLEEGVGRLGQQPRLVLDDAAEVRERRVRRRRVTIDDFARHREILRERLGKRAPRAARQRLGPLVDVAEPSDVEQRVRPRPPAPRARAASHAGPAHR